MDVRQNAPDFKSEPLHKKYLTENAPYLEWGYPEFMPVCEHKKTEFLMRRDGVDYIRCLASDQVFEADDLEQISVYEDESAEVDARH